MIRRRTRQLAVIGLAVASVAASAAPKAPTSQPTLAPADQVQYQQKTVEAQVQELQDRMFHLADLTRTAEPDDSARLLMAVRKAREDLILEQVRDVIDQIARQDYGRATDGQQQVLVKLEELKKLLTSTDLDLQMQLDRLRKLNAAIAKLDAATKEQLRQQQHTAALAAQKPAAKAADGAKQDQAAVHKTTEAIAQALKDLGTAPAAAATTLGGATQDMALAEGQLAGGSPSAASPIQGQAAEQMKKARDQLEKERQKILDELAKQVRKQVVENLTEMLDRQKSIRGATAALVSAGASGGMTSETTARATQLGSAESAIVRINAATLELIDETQFSVALPAALREVGRNCSSIADRLGAGTVNGRVVTEEKQVEQDLTDLLTTFKQLSSDPGPGTCRGCKGNKNKLLAELKVLRLMQSHVAGRTTEVDADRAANPGAGPVDDATRSRIADLAASQSETHDAAEAIHRELSGE